MVRRVGLADVAHEHAHAAGASVVHLHHGLRESLIPIDDRVGVDAVGGADGVVVLPETRPSGAQIVAVQLSVDPAEQELRRACGEPAGGVEPVLLEEEGRRLGLEVVVPDLEGAGGVEEKPPVVAPPGEAA